MSALDIADLIVVVFFLSAIEEGKVSVCNEN
jgi:hypothetical protein